MEKIFAGIKELKSTGEFDKINLSQLDWIMDELETVKREELLAKHPYKIWEGKDGKWYTYLPDEEKGRILKKKTDRNGIFKYAKEKEYITWSISQTIGDTK